MECLSLCSSAQDLSDEQKTEILRYDNGDWNDEKIVHWCCDGCPCGGTKEAALNKIRGAIAISFGSGCDLALEYRWKIWNEVLLGAFGVVCNTSSWTEQWHLHFLEARSIKLWLHWRQ